MLLFAILHAMTMVCFGDVPDAARRIVSRRCAKCHDAKIKKGDVNLLDLSDQLDDSAAAETWHDALHALNRGDMPPKDEPLSRDERATLVQGIRTHLDQLAAAKAPEGRIIRRLNRMEYQNTMRELLGIEHDFVKNLPPDERSKDGFTNQGSALRMSDLQLEFYLQAARRGLAYAVVERDAPPVFRHNVTESTNDKGGGVWTNLLGSSGTFVARIPKFPDHGEFRIRVTAHVEGPKDAAHPTMQIRLGYRADTQTPSRIIASRDVTSAEEQVFEFRGRLEDFPIQSRSQSKYPGMLVWIDNTYDDGKPSSRPKGKKKGKGAVVADPHFPTIVIDRFEFEAPVFLSWPPRHHQRLIPQHTDDKLADVRSSLQTFLPRAFRRDVDDATVQAYVELFAVLRAQSPGFEAAMRETLASALISPEFLYLVEPQSKLTPSLNGFEIASRMSYFLWSSMPDEELFAAARAGKLADPAVRLEQTRRMLKDSRSESLVTEFARQWLDLDAVDRIAINPDFYPRFDLRLKAMMRQESTRYFETLLRKNLPIHLFLESDFAMLNRDLAAHYGVPGSRESLPKGSGFERVSLAGADRRGGLLSQGSSLLSNSTGEDSHPILRGVWIRDRLLNDPPAPPPPNVPNLDDSNVDFANLTVKQQLEMHLENDACADCHRAIDPWGVALEEFDAVGKVRTKIQRPGAIRGKYVYHTVDSKTVLPNGVSVDGARDLQQHLATKWQRPFATALIERLMAYSMGRVMRAADEPSVRKIVDQLEARGWGLGDAVELVIASPNFVQR